MKNHTLRRIGDTGGKLPGGTVRLSVLDDRGEYALQVAKCFQHNAQGRLAFENLVHSCLLMYLAV
jgi:hypothetical protein